MDIILFIIGIFLLVKGQMKISKHKALKGKNARMVGVVALIPAILSFGLAYFNVARGGVSGIITWSFILLTLIAILTLAEKIPANTSTN